MTKKKSSYGKVIRLCLSLNVIPVLVTSYEQGFQGKMERFHGELQTYFWKRKTFKNFNRIRNDLAIWIWRIVEHINKRSSLPRNAKRFQNDGKETMRFRFTERSLICGELMDVGWYDFGNKIFNEWTLGSFIGTSWSWFGQKNHHHLSTPTTRTGRTRHLEKNLFPTHSN